jgi:heme/copper-type cytochrome/quinol oxidase subunit 3
MGTSLADETELRPRRRRSHKKSSKERYETRRRWKTIGWWLLLAVIGIVFVALIAVYAGSSGGD